MLCPLVLTEITVGSTGRYDQNVVGHRSTGFHQHLAFAGVDAGNHVHDDGRVELVIEQ